MNEPPHVLALIPAFNEGARIAEVIDGVRAHLPALVIDDGSTDDTASRAERAGATVLRQTPNRGKGVALRTGFSHAIESGHDAVITLDADGQHDPAEIPCFLEAYRTHGSDLIIGEREFGRMPPVRRLGNSLGRRAFSWALGREIRDNQSGYRLIRRRLMEALLTSDEAGFEFEVEMIVVCVASGYALSGLPIRTIYAGETSHINPIAHILSFTRMVLATRRRTRSRAR